jgi:hypothetical protein
LTAILPAVQSAEKPANRDLGNIKKMKIDDLKSFNPTQFAADLASLDILLSKKERTILKRVASYKDYEKNSFDETKTNYEVINALFKKLVEELEAAKKDKKYTAKEVSMKDSFVVFPMPMIFFDDEEQIGFLNKSKNGRRPKKNPMQVEPTFENKEMTVAHSEYHTTLDRSLDSIETVQRAMKFLLKYATVTK